MSDYSVSQFLSERDGVGPVTCAVCGCRLIGLTGLLDGAYRHFSALKPGQDARGCRPHCVDALHDRDGRALVSAGSMETAAA